jgi:hypothetical protein
MASVKLFKTGMGLLTCAVGTVFAGWHAAAQDVEPVDFEKDIWPIFEASCIECHGPESQKGDLRLDTVEDINLGGTFGPVLVAGNPEESELYRLVSLPADHNDVMPGAGDPLTPEQQEIIKRWIAEGAAFGEWAGMVVEEVEPDILEILAAGTEPAPEAALATVRGTGALAMALDIKSPLVQVNFQLLGDEVTDETLDVLGQVSDQITWLNLAGTAVTDAGLAKIAPLKKLTILHLENTAVTDAGLQHLTGLEHLEYLNLYATEVSDAGIEQLAALKNLKKLYLWQSNVTEAGAEKLTAANPELQINLGLELAKAVEDAEKEMPAEEPQPELAPADEAKPNLSLFFDEGGCCAKAAADGKACDHPCCVEAAEKGEVCPKCNAEGAKKQAVAAKFDKDSCCGKALAEGKFCDHPCCVEALAKGEVCLKCNPGAAPKEPAAAPASLALFFDNDGCCAKASADGKACDHPCCVEAAGKSEVCAKCNAEGAKKQAVAAKFDKESCCAKALAEAKFCDHPCCAEAMAKAEVCTKCNPGAAAAAPAEKPVPDEVAAQFTDDSCCSKALAENKACEHPCCVEALNESKACTKCNPKQVAAAEKKSLNA